MAYHGYIPVVKKFLSEIESPSVLEVGLDRGVTTIPLVNFMTRYHRKSSFFGIDVLIQESLRITLGNMDVSGDHVVRLCRGNSLEVLPMLAKQGAKFDVVLIDGDHNYHTVAKELECLDSLVGERCLVVIDDYHGRWSEADQWYSTLGGYEDVTAATKPVDTERHGVKSAVDEFVEKNSHWRISTLMKGEPVVLSRASDPDYGRSS